MPTYPPCASPVNRGGVEQDTLGQDVGRGPTHMVLEANAGQMVKLLKAGTPS